MIAPQKTFMNYFLKVEVSIRLVLMNLSVLNIFTVSLLFGRTLHHITILL